MRIEASSPAASGMEEAGIDAATAAALDDLLRLAAQVLAAPYALLDLVAGGQRRLSARADASGDDASAPAAGHGLQSLLARVHAGAGLVEDPIAGAAGPVSCAAAPLARAGGTVRGVLAVYGGPVRSGALDTAARFALQALADQALARLELQDTQREAAALRESLAGARAQIDASKRAAHDQASRLDALLSAAPVGICYADRDGRLVLFNAEMERLWGAFPQSATVDEYIAWQGWWADGSARHGQPVAPHEWPLARSLRGERVDGDVIEIQPFAGGPRRSIIQRSAPVLDDTGAVCGSVIAVSETTRQREVEGALRLNEERFRSLVQSSAQSVWICDPFGRPASDSPSWNAYTGQAQGESTGDGWRAAVHPDDLVRVAAVWEGCMRRSEPYEVEYRLRNAAGEYRWNMARGHPIAGPDGVVREWVGTNTDIHDRRLAEIASREWRRRLEAILEAGDVGTWSWEPASGLVQADDNVARLYGIPADLARAGAPVETFLGALHPDDLAPARAGMEATLAGGEPLQGVFRVLRPDGAEVAVNVRGRLEAGADGVPVRISGVALDVTRQAETERQLRSSESARLQGEQRYRTVLNAVDVGFCIIEMIFDGEGQPCDYRILETNPAFAQHTGLRNATGRRIRELVPAHDIRWSRIYGRVARIGLPVRVVQHTGNLGRWLDVYAARIGEPGQFQVAVFLRDVTEERHRSDTLQRLADDLADANRRQSEFLATLAHELRNPLAPVRTGLDLLRIGADKPGVLAKVRPMMERQVNHLVNLVDDLLDLARINSGKIELKKTDVLLKDVVLRAVEMTLPAIEAKRHDFQLDLRDEDTYLFADATRLAQVVGNLLTNAAKYTMEGGSIRLDARKVVDAVGGSRVRIAVLDSGIGIPPESLPRIFDMFTQVGRHPEQEAGGLGIGLHLVRQMTERHGGTVSADSAGPGRGSRFVVELPLAPIARADAGGAPAGQRIAGARRKRILLADDNLDALELLREVLQMEGHAVHAVGNGTAALEAAAWFGADIAFLDIGMPGLNGYEVARRLRALPAGRETVLVAVTGWGTEEDRVKSSEAGFDFHLTKPVDLRSLQEIVARQH